LSGNGTESNPLKVSDDFLDDVESDIGDLETNKVNKTDIATNLTTDDDTKVLSAKQGKILQDNKVNTTDLFNLIYPVGSIYTTVDSGFSPGTTFGGTWSKIAEGRTLVGQDTGDTDFDTIEDPGGAKTVALSIANLATHNHGTSQSNHAHAQIVTANNSSVSSRRDWNNDNNSLSYPQGYNTGGATANITVGNTGSGTAHNNLQPYLVVIFWKRTV